MARPCSFGIEDLLKLPLEERVYRLRCVEAWSMVIPWIGFEFNKLARLVEPTSKAKFVEFVTATQAENMIGLRSRVLPLPYTEGLRIDEAMHPLTIMAVGLYGEVLPNQNGTQIRLVVPWKYGFKSAKSIVRIRFVERQPLTSWQRSVPGEYGFDSNVNPSEPGREPTDPAVQRLRRSSRRFVRRAGFEEVLLSHARSDQTCGVEGTGALPVGQMRPNRARKEPDVTPSAIQLPTMRTEKLGLALFVSPLPTPMIATPINHLFPVSTSDASLCAWAEPQS